MQKVVDLYDKAVIEGIKNQNARQAVKEQKNNTAENYGVQYSLNRNAKSELHKVLYAANYRNDVLLRDNTPAIMLAQKGVKDLPMVMKSSHIRENVFTEEEAKKLGLKVNEHTHYHGLGEDFYLQIIDSLDNVTEAYRGTKYADNSARRENFFLLVSEFNDKNGNIINIPVYINETAQYNRVFISSNKIATVFGKDDFRQYIAREIKKGNLVRIKNKSNTSSERNALIAKGYRSTASNDNIPQYDDTVNNQSMQESENNSKQFSVRDTERDVEIRTSAKEYFGQTFSWNETGYLLPNGNRLDFSGRHEGARGGYRTVDHRDIWDAYPEDLQNELEPSQAMVDFMNRGNIRILPEMNGINLSVIPSKSQFESLDNFISKARGEILLDLDDLNGNTVESIEYPRGTRTSKIINDIKQYFENGVVPSVSDIQAFHNDIRYSVRDDRIDYTNIDLSTLDDKQLKVYNKRGWANSLFTDEDLVLLSEKYNQLNTRTRQRTDNVLGDGSRIVEVNNKLVLIGGTFEEPIIHNVLAINADNETYAEIIKEDFLYDTEGYIYDKESYENICRIEQEVYGDEYIQYYIAENYNYQRGKQDTGERAILPDSFKSYGYTEQFQDGRRDNWEVEQSSVERGRELSDDELIETKIE